MPSKKGENGERGEVKRKEKKVNLIYGKRLGSKVESKLYKRLATQH